MSSQVTKRDDSFVEIEGEIPIEKLEEHRADAMKMFQDKVQLDGFRKGHVPDKVLIDKVGDVAILTEMAERALANHYPEILKEHEIDAIDRPEIQITKLAPGNPLGFKATQAVMPKVTLPKYKEIARKKVEELDKGKAEIVVEDKEVQDVIDRILTGQKKDPKDEKEALPEITDDMVKGLGEFKDVADFRIKLRENIKLEKEHKERDRRRLEIMEAIIEATKLDPPKALVERQMKHFQAEVRANIERMGLKYEDYIKQMGKSEEELHESLRPEAAKKVKLQLILEEIARIEKLEVNDDAIEEEARKIMLQYQNAPETPRLESVKGYVHGILQNEEVFKLLENQ